MKQILASLLTTYVITSNGQSFPQTFQQQTQQGQPFIQLPQLPVFMETPSPITPAPITTTTAATTRARPTTATAPAGTPPAAVVATVSGISPMPPAAGITPIQPSIPISPVTTSTPVNTAPIAS